MTSQGIEKGRTDLLEYLRVIWRKKWLALLVATGVFGIAMWSTYRTELVYEARVTLQLNISGGAAMLDRLGGFSEGPKLIESEIEILKSRVIGERTAVRLQRHYALNPLPAGVSAELTDVTVTEKTLPGVYALTFVDDAGQYQVKNPRGNVIGVGRPGQPFEAGGLSFTASKVAARSGSSVEVSINPLADLGEGLRGSVSAVPIRGTNIIDIRVKANEPREAAGTANAFAETYVDFTRQQNLLRLISVREFLERQLASFRENFLKVGEELGKTSKEGQEMVLGQLTVENVKGELARRLMDLEMQRVAMKFTYTPNHRAVIQVEREIEEIRNRLTKQFRPGKQDMPLLELLQGSQAKLAMYHYMLQKQQETRLAEASELGSARIIDRAIPPKTPVSPNVSRNMRVGGMVSLALGIGLALVVSYLDRSLRNIKDIEEQVGLPVFGAIPEIDCQHRRSRLRLWSRKREYEDPASFLLAGDGGEARVLEAYRSLRTRIRVVVSGGSSRALLFTSPGPGEGKSLTVANLAIAMSQREGRILVVDCDLRKPDQSKLFKVGQQAGISEVLAGKRTWREVTQPTRFENVDVLPCGEIPVDPAELLAGSAMKEFLEEAQKRYAVVLLDSPPALPFTDACVMAPLVSGVLIVVRSRVTSAEAITRVQSTLDAVNAKLIAVILNGVPWSEELLRCYGYYGYYKDVRASGRSHPGNKARMRKAAQRMVRHIRSA